MAPDAIGTCASEHSSANLIPCPSWRVDQAQSCHGAMLTCLRVIVKSRQHAGTNTQWNDCATSPSPTASDPIRQALDRLSGPNKQRWSESSRPRRAPIARQTPAGVLQGLGKRKPLPCHTRLDRSPALAGTFARPHVNEQARGHDCAFRPPRTVACRLVISPTCQQACVPS